MAKIYLLFQVFPDAVDITFQGKTTRHLTKFDATLFLAALAFSSEIKTKEVLSAIDRINRDSELPLGDREYSKAAHRKMKETGLEHIYEKMHAYYAEHICDKPTVVSCIDTTGNSSVEIRLPSGRVIRGLNKFDIFRALENAVTDRLLRIDENEKLREMILSIPILPDFSPQSN